MKVKPLIVDLLWGVIWGADFADLAKLLEQATGMPFEQPLSPPPLLEEIHTLVEEGAVATDNISNTTTITTAQSPPSSHTMIASETLPEPNTTTFTETTTTPEPNSTTTTTTEPNTTITPTAISASNTTDITESEETQPDTAECKQTHPHSLPSGKEEVEDEDVLESDDLLDASEGSDGESDDSTGVCGYDSGYGTQHWWCHVLVFLLVKFCIRNEHK